MFVAPVDSVHAGATIALLDALRVSLFGISSRRLHAALVSDGVAARIDCRVATEADKVCGVVLAAPALLAAAAVAVSALARGSGRSAPLLRRVG